MGHHSRMPHIDHGPSWAVWMWHHWHVWLPHQAIHEKVGVYLLACVGSVVFWGNILK